MLALTWVCVLLSVSSYKLSQIVHCWISATYKLLQSSFPRYLRDVITVQPSRSTRSSTLVTWSPPTTGSLQYQDHKPFIAACWNFETSFLLLFMFFSLVHHHHPALLHRNALIVDRLLTVHITFSTPILKPSFSQSFHPYSHLSFAHAHLSPTCRIWPLGVRQLLAVCWPLRQIMNYIFTYLHTESFTTLHYCHPVPRHSNRGRPFQNWLMSVPMKVQTKPAMIPMIPICPLL